MIYVCLLRGINVGGNNKVDMRTLKDVLSDAGYTSVISYINSGNLLFKSDKTPHVIEEEIHSLIFKTFGVNTQTMILDAKTFIDIAQCIPDHFVDNKDYKADVAFYYTDIDMTAIHALRFSESIDTVIHHEKALIHGIKRSNQGQSGLHKVIGTPVYRSMTIRNVNTVRKLVALIETFET